MAERLKGVGDHPRSRGEYPFNARGEYYNQGSPPLTRGIHYTRFPARKFHGITPAHAGNTKSYNMIVRTEWDHPRSRGEYLLIQMFHLNKSGSPPLTRGIQNLLIAEKYFFGITPAHAGNTITQIRNIVVERDHPRSRGEYAILNILDDHDQGSPPLTRGIL